MLCGKYMNGYHANGPAKWARYVPPGWSSFYGKSPGHKYDEF